MEAESYKCNACGVLIPANNLNHKTRRAKCIFCGNEMIFPKRNSTASPNAKDALEKGVRFFLEKNFASAKACAETVVSMMPENNLPALYIIAYYNAFIADVKSRTSWDNLFKEDLPDAVMEIEEEEEFKKLLLKTILHSSDYEEKIICKFVEFDDINEAAEFIEQFCPIAISRRSNVDWFTSRLKDAFLKVTKDADIPKTWFSLLTAINKNPDSPIVTGEFYLKTKSKHFYENYVLPVGEIIDSISNKELRVKFLSAYNKVKTDYIDKLK